LADVVLDFHSGGRTLDFLPYAAAHALPDAEQERRCFAAVAAFSAPFSMRMIEIDAVGMYDTAAEAMGKVFVTTELSGGGTATAATVGIARRGAMNVLKHAGIVPGVPETGPSLWLDMPSADCFRFAEHEGLVEPCVDLGARVRAGDVVARIHRIDRTGLSPEDYRAAFDGVLAARHFPGLVKMGDCLAVVATVKE
ncbi:MAG: succinylglutamate desuccinylase/aspartoacylase family protein, partial [Microvirga sp.]